MLIERDNGATGYSAVFEDDGKVAYAYLLDDGRIVADVWLYNRAAGQITLHVLIRGQLHATLAPGTKPGWCKLAAKDGPLASVLT